MFFAFYVFVLAFNISLTLTKGFIYGRILAMKQNKFVQLQNENVAITYLRASHHCLQKEKYIKYLMIFLSFGICLAAIFNRYLPQMMPKANNAEAIQQIVATVINLISGVILVVGLVLGFYVSRMHTEGTVLRDKYESYVFGTLNPSILRPISQTMVEEYARRTKRIPDEHFKNFLYGENDDPKIATAQFEYICKEVHSDYKLYLSIQPFFLTIWIGFCVLIILIAISFNDTFVTTLINILIPSLSAITTIGNSWYGCRLQMRQLQNLINITDQINKLSESKKMQYITDEKNMRMLADGLFNYRSSAFVIPNFLEKRFTKHANLEKKANDSVQVNSKENKVVKNNTAKKPNNYINSNKTTQTKTNNQIKQVTSGKQNNQVKMTTQNKSSNQSKPKTVVNKPVNQIPKHPTTAKSQIVQKPKTYNNQQAKKTNPTKVTTNKSK